MFSVYILTLLDTTPRKKSFLTQRDKKLLNLENSLFQRKLLIQREKYKKVIHRNLN